MTDAFVMRSGNSVTAQNKHHHHHLICRTCGKVLPFKDDLLDELEAHIEEAMGFHVLDPRIKVLWTMQRMPKRKE